MHRVVIQIISAFTDVFGLIKWRPLSAKLEMQGECTYAEAYTRKLKRLIIDGDETQQSGHFDYRWRCCYGGVTPGFASGDH